jgi:hypothetical protein
MYSKKIDWEKIKLDAETRDLLSSDSSEDDLEKPEEAHEGEKVKVDLSVRESINSVEERREGDVIKVIEISGSEREERGEKFAGGSGITSMMVTNKMIEILTQLERKTSAM